MLHPILAQKRIFIVYVLGWFILFFIHAGILVEYTALTEGQAISDSAIYNLILMILSLSLYFPLAYSPNSRNTAQNKIIRPNLYYFVNHAIICLITLILWLGASYLLSQLFLGDSHEYVTFTRDSLPLRAAIGTLLLSLQLSLYHIIDFFKHIEEKTIKEEQLKKMVKEAELKALKAQLNPHFLFNSLNSINSLTITDPQSAGQMVTKLSDFLRYSLRNNTESMLPLREELNNMRRYLDIEKVRFGDRLNCNFDISEECLDVYIPAMLLQPVFENAIKHGLHESIEPVHIHTSCYIQNNYLIITVSNNFDPESTPVKGEGVGLDNIRNKLFLFYNRNDLFSTKQESNFFEVNFSIPKRISHA
ncbi:sensor histidine kinase [Thermophagus xiamenensis]|uniref:Histidine kinase n=1 Tax=Thermophagus xiamenensis TaxID=385682 RepID=A0A1I1UMH2_9BACT|nr:histidine kinase [Thermophagus xiamenensis]SFD69973.1 Histidine kinase [Thermophagus xiamenensis]